LTVSNMCVLPPLNLASRLLPIYRHAQLSDGPPETQGRQGALKLKSGDNSFDGLPGLIDPTSCWLATRTGAIMAKRKKQSKAQKRKVATVRGKARKVAKAAKATKRTAKPKPAPVKKAARKVKKPVAPVVETAAVEVIEQPVAVTEAEEMRKAS
jgi:hypothetical protein